MWSPTIMLMIVHLHCGTTSNHTVLWYPAPTPQHQCRLAQESPPRCGTEVPSFAILRWRSQDQDRLILVKDSTPTRGQSYCVHAE
ncbi:hypothetical protein D6C92_02563 [Aureobasidium pullulans]|nr:hypothetical protein D6C92_02563 [Aureobasidium pullulans]